MLCERQRLPSSCYVKRFDSNSGFLEKFLFSEVSFRSAARDKLLFSHFLLVWDCYLNLWVHQCIMCGGLNENGPHRLIGSGTIRRCGLEE